MAPDSENNKGKDKSGHKLRSTLARILKAPTKPLSIRYDDTTAFTPRATPPFQPIDPFSLSTMGPNGLLSALRAGRASSDDSSDTGKEPLIIRFYDPHVKAQDSYGRTLEDILAWKDHQLEYSHNYIQMLFPLPEGSPYNISAPIINRRVLEAFRARPELRNMLRKSLIRILRFYGLELLTRQEARERESEVEGDNEEKKDETNSPSVSNERSVSNEPQAESNKLESDDIMVSDTIIPPEQPTKPANTDSTAQPTVSPSQDSGVNSDFVVVRGENWPVNSRNWCMRFDHNHLRITRILRCLRVLGLQQECEAFYAVLVDVFNDPRSHLGERTMSYWKKAVKRPLYIAPDDDRVPWLRNWEEEQAEKERITKEERKSHDAEEAGETASKKIKLDTDEKSEAALRSSKSDTQIEGVGSKDNIKVPVSATDPRSKDGPTGDDKV